METTVAQQNSLQSLIQIPTGDFTRFLKLWQRSKWLDIDSRSLPASSLFVALSGIHHDGHNYIKNIIRSKKIVGVFADPSYPLQSQTDEKKIIRIKNLGKIGGDLAKLFYHNPTNNLQVIGITGTDGKTSTAEILSQSYHRLGFSTAQIGTLGVKGVSLPHLQIPNMHIPNTTPHPIILQQIFYSLIQKNISVVVMEVSSHGIDQDRVKGIEFDSVLWTNLSSEHLDYHHTLKNYAHAKFKLFSLLENSTKPNRLGVVGLDSFIGLSSTQHQTWVHQILSHLKTDFSFPIIFFSKQGQKSKNILSPQYRYRYTHSGKHPSLVITSKLQKHYRFATNLLGDFNGENLTIAFMELLNQKRCTYHRNWLQTVQSTYNHISVPGRLEKFDSPLLLGSVFIDYAHTPAALEKVLLVLKKITEDKLICVFGCGGDRDTRKRKPMGEVAVKYADISIITSDNPRTEDPQKIINPIILGWKSGYKQLSKQERASKQMLTILNRREAIKQALTMLNRNGTLLLAGKGHEDYQIIGKSKYPFDEKKIINTILSNQEKIIKTKKT